MKFKSSNNSGIKVVNRYKETEDVYIGRGSPLGNPYHTGTHGTRDEVIAKYKDYLITEINNNNKTIINELNRIHALSQHKEVKLGCFCKPKSCHGDVIKEYLEVFGSIESNSDEIVIAFTGHRPPKIGGYTVPNPLWTWIANAIEDKLNKLKPTGIITGMALGVDTLAAQMADFMGIPFIAAVPFKGQESKWLPESVELYNELLSKAHKVVYTSEEGYAPYKMQVRNQWMVDNCTHLIAVWDGSKGGTANCVSYAKQQGTRIIHIDPTKANL